MSVSGADLPCVSCVGGKLALHTFPDQGPDDNDVLAVMLVDLCGPFLVAATDGSLYFLLLKDHRTRYMWVRPVAKKSDALQEFVQWLVVIERQTKKSVLMLRSDRGGEFLGKQFTEFVNSKGIVHNLTCPYTPQQNGMAEREMRTVVESVRTMLLHMGVQHHWWHFALPQAVWVRNCLERSTLRPRTMPYQLLTRKKPDLPLARSTPSGEEQAEEVQPTVVKSAKGAGTRQQLIGEQVAAKPTKKQPATGQSAVEPTTEERSAGTPTVVLEDAEDSNASGNEAKQADDEESTNSNEVEVGPRRTGRHQSPPDFFVPAAFTKVYDKVDDDLLYDDAEEDEDLPELDPDMHAHPEHPREGKAGVKGFTQVYGADYDETYAPVSSYVTLRILLSIVTILDLNLMQLDMKNAFQQSKLDRVLYMYQPDNFNDGTGRKYLGLEIVRDKSVRKMWLHQQGYADKLRRRFLDEEQNGHTLKTPVSVDAYATLTFDDEEAQERQEEEYQQKVGSLKFAATTTRPDIAFACSKLGSGLTVRSDQHWHKVDRCLAYLANTLDTALDFGYVDVDDAGDKHNRTSTGGYVFVFGGAVVSWSSQRIKCATLSLTGSEYVAETNALKEGRRLRFLLAEFRQLDAGTPTVLWVDNKSAITVTEGMGLTSNLTHMERRQAWLQHMVKHRKFSLRYIPTAEQPADSLTKALHYPAFNRCCVAIGQMRLVDVGDSDNDVQQ
ncbi:unnamed protein product [Closterium sp. NIES-53]